MKKHLLSASLPNKTKKGDVVAKDEEVVVTSIGEILDNWSSKAYQGRFIAD